MVSIRPTTSKFSSPSYNPLVTVPNAPITIGIIVTCMSHSFFNSLARSMYLSFFSHSFSFILWSAGTSNSLMVFLWSVSDCKSQDSSTVLSILANLNNVVIWMVSILALISKSSSPGINLLLTVLGFPFTISNTVTFMFNCFIFSSLARSWYLSLFSLSFSFTLWSAKTAKITLKYFLFFYVFCFCWLSLSLVIGPKLDDPFVYQKPKEFCASHFLERILDCAYTTCSYSQILNFWTIPRGSASSHSRIQSFILFARIYFMCVLYHWSFRLCHHIIYICYFIVQCLFLLSLFCVAIRRDSVSLLRFPFLSPV